jgi:hypothetical protein
MPEALLRDPSRSDFLYGFDNLAKSLLPAPADTGAHASGIYNLLVQSNGGGLADERRGVQSTLLKCHFRNPTRASMEGPTPAGRAPKGNRYYAQLWATVADLATSVAAPVDSPIVYIHHRKLDLIGDLRQ